LKLVALVTFHIREALRPLRRAGVPRHRPAPAGRPSLRRRRRQAVLEREHPPAGEDVPPSPLAGQGPQLLGEVEAASIDGYGQLDAKPATKPPGGKDDHGA
jgi:hypothetical protein